MKKNNEYNDYLVPLSVAKALNDVKIQLYSPECFIINENMDENTIMDGWSGLIGDGYTLLYYRPTLSSILQYLIKEYNLYITIQYSFYKTGINYLWQIFEYEPDDLDCVTNNSTGLYGDNHEYPTYESALIGAILKACEIIKNKS